MALLSFLSTTAGRWTRGIAGGALIALGVLLGGWAYLLVALGVVFVVAGAGDLCLLGPLVGKPVRGADFRASMAS